MISTWGYDPLGRLLRLRTESGAGQLALYTYGLDKAGHRLRIDETIDPDPTTSNDEFTRTALYEYDQLYRLTKETVTDTLTGTTKAFEQSYTFDKVGNRLRKIIATVSSYNLPSGWTAGTIKSEYNARDQLLRHKDGSDAVTEKFRYDANGSLTTRKNGSDALLFRQGYDLKNRLVEADADGDGDPDLRLSYDHQEGRVARHELDGQGQIASSQHYLLDRMNPTGYEQVLEQAATLDGTPTRSFVYGLGLGPVHQADGSTLRSFLYDGHSTSRGLVDATGRLASSQILAYDAFGVRADAHSAVLTPIQYTAQWFDEVLGQGYHRHRWLAYVTGTWNTFDQYEGHQEHPLTLHKRGYTHADPLNQVDPTGHRSLGELLFVMKLQLGRFAYFAGPAARIGLFAYDIYSVLDIVTKCIDEGRAPTPLEWIEVSSVALAALTAVPASRIVAKAIIGQALGITIGPAVRTFAGAKIAVGQLVKVRPFFSEAERLRGGVVRLGEFWAKDGNAVIRYFDKLGDIAEDGDFELAKTMLHELGHYIHWEKAGRPVHAAYDAFVDHTNSMDNLWEAIAGIVLELAAKK